MVEGLLQCAVRAGPPGKLSAAARRWALAKPTAEPDPLGGSAQAFNITVEGWEPPQGREIEIWPDNAAAISAFMHVRTQWRSGFAGPTGLDYPAVMATLEVHRVANREEIFEDLQVMESAILAAWAENAKRGRR